MACNDEVLIGETGSVLIGVEFGGSVGFGCGVVVGSDGFGCGVLNGDVGFGNGSVVSGSVVGADWRLWDGFTPSAGSQKFSLERSSNSRTTKPSGHVD